VTSTSKASDIIVEFYKLIPPTAGIMLALIWGLANRSIPLTHNVLISIRIASILLAFSICATFIGLGYTVDAVHYKKDPYSRKSVSFWMQSSWILFVAGTVFVVFSLFQA